MKKYYPIMLDVENKQCFVIGGGKVAYRKTLSLLEYMASVTVISRDVIEEFKELIELKKIKFINDTYSYEYIKGGYLVYASTNSREVNEKIYRDCIKNNKLVNVVDEPDICNFIVPSKLQRGDLTIAVSTNGKSPTLAKKIREDMEESFDFKYEIFLEIMGDIRKIAPEYIKDIHLRNEFYKEIVYSDIINRIDFENKEQIKEEIYRILISYGNKDL
ncbi:MAG: bifunctional precorrin-2 dehydrogenase/sirohydrochlorin ferrochelatase [Bacillota bacterium]|nr:bifunctional precorrin-2 dehydrogenase/sirohydrochlorin ferrochelatase [Bacillota bacterium]